MSNDVNIAQRVIYFRQIRDIPYRIALSLEEQDYCCATKPSMLATMLLSLGLETRRILCTFKWSDLGIPQDLLSLAPSSEDTHEYLEVLLPEKNIWVKVDATWDSSLKEAGFKISDWDGLTSTVLGVQPVRTFSPKESAEIIKEEDEENPEIRKKYLEDNRKFFIALNKWMRSFRDVNYPHP